jgi:hypothetical protein
MGLCHALVRPPPHPCGRRNPFPAHHNPLPFPQRGPPRQREKLEAAVAAPGELGTEAVEEFMSISDGQVRWKLITDV